MLEILSKTKRSSIFSTPYIMQFIEYQWNSPLKNSFAIILFMYLSSFALILFASTCVTGFRGSEINGDILRMVFMLIDAILMFISVGLFEFRQIAVQKGKYF